MYPKPPSPAPPRPLRGVACACGHMLWIRGDTDVYEIPDPVGPCPECHPMGLAPVRSRSGGPRRPFVLTLTVGDAPQETPEPLWSRLLAALEGLVSELPADAPSPEHPGWGPILSLIAEARHEDVRATAARLGPR
jgi:hypothetical protein